MIQFKFATAWPVIVLLTLVFAGGCRKELQEIPLSEPANELVNRSISLEEVKGRFSNGGGALDRSEDKLPLCVTPLWNESYIVTPSGFPVLITPVDTPASLPGTRFGSSLAFYKDPAGQIQSKLVLWAADSLSTFFPLWMLPVSSMVL